MSLGNFQSPTDAILLQGAQLQLAEDQLRQLREIDFIFRTTAMRLVYERDLVLLALQRHGGDFFAATSLTASDLAAIDAGATKLRQAWLEARDAVVAVVTPEQLAQLPQGLGRLPDLNAEREVAPPNEIETIVERALGARLKDSKTVEIEIAQAIAERLMGWGKTFALLVGVPLALLAVVLTVLGIRSWNDFNTSVEQGKKEIEARLLATTTTANNLDVQAKQLTGQYDDLKRKFGDVSSLETEIERLANKVSRLENIQYKNLPATGSGSKAVVNQKMEAFGVYLHSIGYKPHSQTFEFVVDSNVGANAFYDGKRLVISPELVGMPDIYLHAYTRRALDEQNPDQNFAIDQAMGAISSGIADYLPASFLGDPIIGRGFVKVFHDKLEPEMVKQGYIRTMENSKSFPIAQAGEAHVVGEVWSGVFWELRGFVGCAPSVPQCEKADRLIFATWGEVAPKPVTTFGKRFAVRLVMNTRTVAGTPIADRLQNEFMRRGFHF